MFHNSVQLKRTNLVSNVMLTLEDFSKVPSEMQADLRTCCKYQCVHADFVFIINFINFIKKNSIALI